MNKVKLNIKRLEAYTIDCILIGVISYLISITSKGILTVFNSSFHPTLFIDILNLLITILYFCFFESSNMQSTPGKNISGIYVSSKNGKLDFSQAFIRNSFKLLPFSIALYYFSNTTFLVKDTDYYSSTINNFSNLASLIEMSSNIYIAILLCFIPVLFTKQSLTAYDLITNSRVKITDHIQSKKNILHLVLKFLAWVNILILYILPFLFLTASFLLKDEKLNPEIPKYRKSLLKNDFSKDNGFIHMLALVLPEEEKRFEKAKSLLMRSVSKDPNERTKAEKIYEKYREENSIKLPNANEVININKALLKRYRDLYQYEYVSFINGNLRLPFYTLKHLRIINYSEIKMLLDQRKFSEAFNRLEQDILFWQKLLDDKTSLIHKIIIFQSYSSGLLYLNKILYKYPEHEKVLINKFEKILKESVLETKLYEIYKQDVLMNNFVSGRIFSDLSTISPLLFINQVENECFERSLRVSNFAKLSLNDAKKANQDYLDEEKELDKFSLFNIYNFFGKALKSITKVDLSRYLINYHKLISLEKYLKANVLLKKSKLKSNDKQKYLNELPKSLQNHFLEKPFIYNPVIDEIDCYDALKGSFVDINSIENNIKDNLKRKGLSSRNAQEIDYKYSIQIRVQQNPQEKRPRVTILKSNAPKSINDSILKASKLVKEMEIQIPFICPYEFSQEIDFNMLVRMNGKSSESQNINQ